MPDKNKDNDKIKRKEEARWITEAAYDLPLTLEDLIEDPPFHESSDPDGSSYTAAARLPDWIRRRIRRLMEADGTPYDIESDVVRDAIHKGLQILSMKYRAGSDWQVESKMAKTVDQSTVAKRIKRQVDDLRGGLEELYEDGDVEQAAKRLTEYVMAAVALDNEWHRDRLFRLMRENKFIRGLAEHCNDAVQELLLKRRGGRK